MKGLLAAQGAPARARLERWLLAGGLAAAVLLVLAEWIRVQGEPLGPDATVFRQLARDDLRSLYDTGHREPLHVWVAWLVRALFGDSDAAFRGATVALYGLALGVYYATTRALLGRGLAAVCFFFFALARKNAALSVEGVRNFEVVIALCLLALAGRRALERPGSARRHALAGLASGLAALAYLSLLVVTQLWLWGCLAAARALRPRALLALAIPVLLVLPHLAHNRRTMGNALETLDRHARFYRNLEYEGRPGYPTREERERDPYAGPPVTGVGYVLEGRSPGEIAGTLARGLFLGATSRAPSYEAYRTPAFPHGGVPLWAATVLGGALIVLRRRSLLWIPGLALACGLPFAFLLGIHQLDGRLLNDSLFVWLWLLAGLAPSDERLASGP